MPKSVAERLLLTLLVVVLINFPAFPHISACNVGLFNLGIGNFGFFNVGYKNVGVGNIGERNYGVLNILAVKTIGANNFKTHDKIAFGNLGFKYGKGKTLQT